MGRIRYGISKVYYSTITYSGSTEVYTVPVALPGAKSISLDAQSETLDEYADNTTWFHLDVSNGYTGTLELEDTAAADLFMETVLGWDKNSTTGLVKESSTDKPVEFALLGQFELAGDTDTGKRFKLVRCLASRPQLAGQTKESNITVNTNTINLTCLPRLSDNVVKLTASSGATAYSTWFTTM